MYIGGYTQLKITFKITESTVMSFVCFHHLFFIGSVLWGCWMMESVTNCSVVGLSFFCLSDKTSYLISTLAIPRLMSALIKLCIWVILLLLHFCIVGILP